MKNIVKNYFWLIKAFIPFLYITTSPLIGLGLHYLFGFETNSTIVLALTLPPLIIVLMTITIFEFILNGVIGIETSTFKSEGIDLLFTKVGIITFIFWFVIGCLFACINLYRKNHKID